MNYLLIIMGIVVAIALIVLLAKISDVKMNTFGHLFWTICCTTVSLGVLNNLFSCETEKDLLLHTAKYVIRAIGVWYILDHFD